MGSILREERATRGKVRDEGDIGKRGLMYDKHGELKAWQWCCIEGVMAALEGAKISASLCRYRHSIDPQQNSCT